MLLDRNFKAGGGGFAGTPYRRRQNLLLYPFRATILIITSAFTSDRPPRLASAQMKLQERNMHNSLLYGIDRQSAADTQYGQKKKKKSRQVFILYRDGVTINGITYLR
jgi:hypothetical protein